MEITRSALLEIEVTPNHSGPGYDVDLYLQRRQGNQWLPVLVSGNSGAEESIRVTNPPPGQYRALVNGYSVPAGATYDIRIVDIGGEDLEVRGASSAPLQPGEATSFRVGWDMGFDDVRSGVVFVGPRGAPAVVQIPVTAGPAPRLYVPLVAAGGFLGEAPSGR
jgi:hypothetical protein